MTHYFKSMSSSNSSIISQQPILPTTKNTTQTYTLPKQRELAVEIEEIKNQITTTSKHYAHFNLEDHKEYIKHKAHLSQLQSNLKKLRCQLTTKKRLAQTQKRCRDKRRNKKIKIKK